MDDPYSFFGDVVCINLESRPDRRAYAQKVFDDLRIPARFLTVPKHPQGGIYGCFDSHMIVVLEALREGKDNVLVFEDDLLPTASYSPAQIQDAVRFMQSDTTWDIFYLGYMTFNFDSAFIQARPVGPRHPHVVQYNPFATHAMVYSHRAMESIAKTYRKYIEEKMHYDIFLSGHAQLTNYCYAPTLFDQAMCMASDIEAATTLEWVCRSVQCGIERSKIVYYVSLLKYHLGRWWPPAMMFVVWVLFVAGVLACHRIFARGKGRHV